MSDFDVIICGAGVIGLSVARGLAQAGLKTAIVEKNSMFGQGTSSRNSEVIHAGIYYKYDSLKHKMCIRGRRLLYSYIIDNQLPFRKCGKLIISTGHDQDSALEILFKNALNNGVENIKWLSTSEIVQFEPNVQATAAIYSAETGILDSHSFMESLLFEYEECGGIFAVNTEVSDIKPGKNDIKVLFHNEQVTTKAFINCAGLFGTILHDKFARFLPTNTKFDYRYAKGSYFSITGSSPFSSLIYPMPDNGGLGVHSTIDLNGRTKFGPDIDWLDSKITASELNYVVDPQKREIFRQKISKYWPGIKSRELLPDYAGVRPKLMVDNELYDDFYIADYTLDEGGRYISCMGMESPGLTASLAVAEKVEKTLMEDLKWKS